MYHQPTHHYIVISLNLINIMRPEDREALLEQENRERTDRLAAKVSALKNFTMDMEQEARDQNRLLDDVSTGFDSTFGFMSGGRNRLNRLLQSNRGNKKFLCYLSFAIAVFLFVIYFLIGRALSS